MQLDNSFEVAAPPERVWDFLLDVEQVAPCMPGAELTEVVDDRTWKGKVAVKLGPVGLTYAGKVVIDERDDDARRVVLKATGQETRGKGTAQATVTSRVEPAGAGSRVQFTTDMTLSGPAAQFGRGMVEDVSKRLTDQFADCIKQRLSTPAQPSPATPASGDAGAAATGPASRSRPQSAATSAPATSKPVAGIRLGLWTLWRAVARLVGRVRRRR